MLPTVHICNRKVDQVMKSVRGCSGANVRGALRPEHTEATIGSLRIELSASKRLYNVGRQVGVADIVLSHGSISREQATLTVSASGSVVVADLASASRRAKVAGGPGSSRVSVARHPWRRAHNTIPKKTDSANINFSLKEYLSQNELYVLNIFIYE